MSMAAPPPIPGEPVDPPPRSAGATFDAIQGRTRAGGVAYRAVLRFTGSHGPLLAAGTTYFIFLSIFSLVALAFGLVALLGSDQMATYLSSALDEALPGLVGSGGVDADQLRAIGQSTSIIGMVAFLYSGTGVMSAASSGLHLIYGAPKDPRNFLLMRLRLLWWLVLMAPLLLLSLTPSLLVAQFGDPVLEAIGIGGTGWAHALAFVVSYAVSLCLNFLIIYLLLGSLGGIKPQAVPRRIGAGIGALVIELLRFAMAGVVAWAIDRPQYGAFAVPIAIMLVFFLQCLVFYFCAAVVAAMAEYRGGEVPESMNVTRTASDPFAAASPVDEGLPMDGIRASGGDDAVVRPDYRALPDTMAEEARPFVPQQSSPEDADASAPR